MDIVLKIKFGDMSPDLKSFELGDASTKDKIKRDIYWI